MTNLPTRNAMSDEQIRTEKHKVSGEGLVGKIEELVHQGNIRRIIVKNDEERTLLEIPLTVGVVGAVLLPVWVALGAIAALASNFTLEVEKVEKTG
jgi:hypothetical protein